MLAPHPHFYSTLMKNPQPFPETVEKFGRGDRGYVYSLALLFTQYFFKEGYAWFRNGSYLYQNH